MKLFTDKQIKAINRKVNGDKSDSTGMFARIRPKIKELVNILEEPKALKFWKKVLKGENE